MKTAIALALLVASSVAHADEPTHVNGYTKKDGTVVAPHDRSAPNGTERDNYGTKGNTNPSTGSAGTKTPKK